MTPSLHLGLERLFEHLPERYRYQRVGLICNQASVDHHYRHALDRFAACQDFRLTTAFGPQHGARGDKQDNMIESTDFFDERLNIPIYSLYGQHRQPTPDMLADLDVLFCDLVDVGARIYTFIYTMALAMKACADQGKAFVVLDRPNPINGLDVEGNMLDPAFRSFVGWYPIPMRHGMTAGELAVLFNRHFQIGVELEVIAMQGWKRSQWQDETGLPWVLPSPNMPTPETAVVYPGAVLIEGTRISEGRGTTRPFELVGAPFIDPFRWAQQLNDLELTGIHFRPAWFQPTFNKGSQQLCGGVQLHVTKRNSFKPYLCGLALLQTLLQIYPQQFAWLDPPYEYEYEKLPIDILLGTDQIRPQLAEGVGLEDIEESWQPSLQAFKEIRKQFLLYE